MLRNENVGRGKSSTRAMDKNGVRARAFVRRCYTLFDRTRYSCYRVPLDHTFAGGACWKRADQVHIYTRIYQTDER